MNIKKGLFVLLLVFAFVFVACGEETPQVEQKVNVVEEEMNLEIGEDKVIVAEKSEGAVLEWTTSNDKVATVTSGKVVAVGEGSCVITVTIQGTEIKDQITVNVASAVVLVESVEVQGVSSIYTNKSTKYTYAVTPSDASYEGVKWSVSDESVATIDEEGNLSALKEGTVKVICEVNGVKGELEVTVNPPQPVEPTDIKLFVNGELIENGGTINIVEFDTAQLTFEYLPVDTPVLEGVDVSTGNEYTLSVSEDFVITALVPGQTYLIVCSVYADIEVSYNVVISEKHFLPESVTVTGSETEILVGQSLTVSATVLPERAADDVVWSSADESIATVDENGVVTATTPEVETVKGEYEITIKEAPSVTLDTVLVCPANGDNVVEYEGKKYYKDLNMFADAVKAVEKVEDGGKVVFLAGEHTLTGRAVINKTITILGPNADKKMGEERVDEAVINIDGNSADANSFEIRAKGIVFNGLKFTSNGAQAHTFLAGDEVEDFTVKSCYIHKINTPIESISNTTYKGVMTISDCYFDQLVQFIVWFKDGDKVELTELNIVNNKFFGEYSSYAGKGALSLRTAGATYTVNFKYNEVDLSAYTFNTNPYLIWVNSGTFNVQYNIFKAVPDDKLFGNTMTTTNAEYNLFVDAEGNVVANPKLGANITSKNDFESLDKYNEAISKLEK